MSSSNMTNKEQCDQARVKAHRHENIIEPLVDIFETDAALTLVADLPGVQEQNLEITIDKDILTIDGEGAGPPEGRSGAKEFRYGHYRRQFRLSDAVDNDKVSAQLTRGVLTLTLPKTEAAVPRRVDVTTVH